jgi:hypothetical protein
MNRDFLEHLADLDVAAPPPQFDRQLHQRVNHWLLAQQCLDFVVGAAPWALFHFAQAVAGLLFFSVTGRFADHRRKNP